MRSIFVIPAYSYAEFLGGISTDYRGVDWYQVRYRGYEGWVSSKFSILE